MSQKPETSTFLEKGLRMFFAVPSTPGIAGETRVFGGHVVLSLPLQRAVNFHVTVKAKGRLRTEIAAAVKARDLVKHEHHCTGPTATKD